MSGRSLYYKKEILDAVNFADANIREDISWCDAAEDAWHSGWHFHRIFAACTGITLSDYIRRRRLSLAAEEMCRKNKRIIDIAYDFRFSHEQSFIRAFKREFGITPGTFRKRKIPLTIFPRITASTILNKNKNDYQIVLCHGFKLAGKRHVVNYEENNLHSVCSILTKEFIGKYVPAFEAKRAETLFAYDEKIRGDSHNFYTMPSVRIDDKAKIPSGFDVKEIPFHLSYRTVWGFTRPLSEIPNPEIEKIYIDLYDKKIVSSGYSVSGRYDYSSSLLQPSGKKNSFAINIPVMEN
ncbi:MAG: helix-turn-helix domain-containing protein [Spirochaetes bacterium]|nr:helix-turn-helix domain-containing protein [Spirochaetota bacterium]